ncbi:MAG TPA: Lacal_2735 family protein [Bacteroidales bacterium]|nr:Lacal_2735 family protein [Bacteroidales bacterium]
MSIFNKDPKKKLAKKYDKLMSEGYKLSTVNRKLSDEKYAEANRVKAEIDKLNS